jgi:hypothetical protein
LLNSVVLVGILTTNLWTYEKSFGRFSGNSSAQRMWREKASRWLSECELCRL